MHHDIHQDISLACQSCDSFKSRSRTLIWEDLGDFEDLVLK